MSPTGCRQSLLLLAAQRRATLHWMGMTSGLPFRPAPAHLGRKCCTISVKKFIDGDCELFKESLQSGTGHTILIEFVLCSIFSDNCYTGLCTCKP